MDGGVDRDEGVDHGPSVEVGELVEQSLLERAGGLAEQPQVRLEVAGEGRVVGERDLLGVLLDEEVEGVDDPEVRDQADHDLEPIGGLGEDQSGEVVAERVLLPVDEVVLRGHPQGVGLDRRAAVRGRAQPDGVGSEGDASVERVRRAVLERDLDPHAQRP